MDLIQTVLTLCCVHVLCVPSWGACSATVCAVLISRAVQSQAPLVDTLLQEEFVILSYSKDM